MAARSPSGSDFGAHARHCVGVRPLLCHHHGCKLEIPLYPTHRFLNRDYTMFDCRGMAFSEAGFHASCDSKVRGFRLHHDRVVQIHLFYFHSSGAAELRSAWTGGTPGPTRAFSVQSVRYTIFPPTMVATTLPVSCHPSKGVFCDLEWDFAASNVQRFLGSKIVTSA